MRNLSFPFGDRHWFVVLLIVVAAFSGCSGNMGAQVSGTVTLDDKPLTTGNVAFVPAGGTGTISYGQVDAAGKYTINTATAEGLPPGNYSVTVISTEPLPATAGEVEITPKVLTPAKYSDASTTDLKIEVKPGKNDIPLKLSSQP